MIVPVAMRPSPSNPSVARLNHAIFRGLVGVILFGLFSLGLHGADLKTIFRNPPPAARPWVFWYWVQGAVSRAGITADLEAMQRAGIGGAYLFTVSPPANPPLYPPVAKPLTPEWWALIRHAATEADRLGLPLGFNICDGFATAGGPWITPDLAMQKLVWSETIVSGGAALSAPLPLPPANENYYRDVAVLALPLRVPDAELTSRDVSVKVTTSLPGAAAPFLAAGGDGEKQFRSDHPCWIQYEFAEPFIARSLVVRQWDHNYGGIYHATRLRLEVSDDGKIFRALTRLTPPRHGWQDWDADATFTLPETTARFFRFVHDPTDSEPGAEDLDGAKWKPKLTLRGLLLSSAPRLPGYEGKSAAVWRRSPRATDAQLPAALCVPRARIVDLTANLSADGHLAWTPPAGRWKILRFGHTATGHRNETATAARGLECDKLNPAAVRLQFDRWFGEIVRQLGPDLAARVVKIFHVDSWEAGSQNWTPAFREEFRRRRGYDPVPLLPAMAGVPIGNAAESENFLADIRRTIAELTVEKFFGTLATLAHEHGCVFSAEATAPTMTGDGMAPFANVDLPTGEFWLRSPTHDKPNDIADAVSAAHVYGKNLVQAEAFTELRLQWDETPALLKPLADHAFASGINRLLLHVFVHNPWLDRRPGLTLGGVGTFLQRDQTWWPDARAWTDYLARCSALLQVGRPVADVAYFTGEELPARALLPERRSSPLPAGYAADSINLDALLRVARIAGDRFVLPDGSRYAALVLPRDDPTPSVPLAAKLAAMHALIVAPGDSIATQLERAGVAPDLLAKEADGSPANSFEWTHRTTPDAEIYFLSNQSGSARRLRLSFRGAGTPEIWQPIDASTMRVGGSKLVDHRTELEADFEPLGSLFVILRPTNLDPRDAARAIEGELHEAMTLAGSWTVTFPSALGGPPETTEFPRLLDWTARSEPGIKYYSGTATYRCEFECPPTKPDRRVWLDLGRVADLARVRVNDIDCGVAWTFPYRTEITSALRPGRNLLVLEVTNTWRNRLIGDRLAAVSTRPLTWTSAPLRDATPLLPAGLLGPVRLLVE